jgi:CrcB protein
MAAHDSPGEHSPDQDSPDEHGFGEQGIDPDVDLHVPAQRLELRLHPALLLGSIAAGGVLGSEARYALTLAFPDRAGAVPWTTLAINVGGCLAMGLLMVAVPRYATRRPLLRPFAGVGVLGGFTTFSAYAVGVERLAGDHPGAALAYLALTPALAVPAAALGAGLGRLVLPRREVPT